MTPTPRGKRLGPLEVPVDEEVESLHLKFLQQAPIGWTYSEAVHRFNANVSYSGLLHAVTGEVSILYYRFENVSFAVLFSIFH